MSGTLRISTRGLRSLKKRSSQSSAMSTTSRPSASKASFAWPGIGKLVVDSIFRRDFPVVQTILILSATIFIVINFVVDLLYSYLDPRVRLGGAAAAH